METIPIGTVLEDATEGKGTVTEIRDGHYVILMDNGKTITMPVDAIRITKASLTPFNPDLNRYRIRTGYFASVDQMGFNGAFQVDVTYTKTTGDTKTDDVFVICSNQAGWEHVSVSLLHRPKVVPCWELMCAVKDLFWGPEIEVMQFHPKASEYVNCHKGCLHLWRSTLDPMPKPPSYMVGPKEDSQ
jgi:hypothetical protein